MLQGSFAGLTCREPPVALEVQDDLLAVLARASSGRELIERDFAEDVALAAAHDVSSCAPRFDGGAFVV